MFRRIPGIICVLLCSWLLLFPLSGSDLYALTASATVSGSKMTVSGQASAGDPVSIMVERSDGKRCYLGQTTADHSGNYSLSFSLSKGDYKALAAVAGQQAETAQQTITQNPSGGGGGGIITPTPDPDALEATVSVTGDADTGVMLPAAPWQWTGQCTVLQALKGVLDSQGISYELRSNGYLARIGNLSEKKPGYPLSGWLFRLNGSFPPSGADSTIIHDGDVIEWLYTMNGGADLGSVPLTIEELPGINEQTNSELTVMLQGFASMMSGLQDCCIINVSQRMTAAEAQLLQQKLDGNQVTLEGKVSADGGIIYDSMQEVVVLVPEKALTGETLFMVLEEKETVETAGVQYHPYSNLYNLQPDGSKFPNPVRIAIRLSIPPGVKAESLTPAWYNTSTKQWEAIPGIIDLKRGTAIFDTNHFSIFAVVQKADAQTALARDDSKNSDFDYSEVEKNYPWALTAVKSLSEQGIMVGSERGFEPGRVITRAEMAALLQRSLKPVVTGADLALKDVSAGSWYYSVIQTAVKSGWISGYPDKTFHPEAVINRYEAAGMLFNAVSATAKGINTGGTSFSDYKQAPGWVQPALQYIAVKGLMHGYPDGSFGGTKPLNRAEAAVIIWGMLNGK